MLKEKIYNFLHYCQVSNFSDKSIESLSRGLKELTYNLYPSYRSDLWKIFHSKAGSKSHFLLDQEPGAWNEPGDLLWNAIVAGDFNDGDGYNDLAVGAPGEASGADPSLPELLNINIPDRSIL